MKATRKKRQKKTALVICKDRKQFWTTQAQFWQWVREGVVTKTGDRPLAGRFKPELEDAMELWLGAILGLGLPNFAQGLHSAHDWFGRFMPQMHHYYGVSKSPEELDWSALGSDWSTVGSDLEDAIEETERTKLAASE